MPAGPKIAVLALILGLCSGASGASAQSRPGQTQPPQAFDGSFWTRASSDKSSGSPLDPASLCTSAGGSPLCALKTYLACVLYDAPHLCAAVGLDKVPERYPGPDTLDAAVLSEPWTLPFERLMPEAFAVHIYDGGDVPASRFQIRRGASTAYDPLPGAAAATELLMDIPEPYVKGMVYRLSFFFRPVSGAWHLTSWSSSRPKACDVSFGTASWAPCRWFVKNLRLRDVFAADSKPVWASPKTPGHDDYPHPGLEIMTGMPNEPVMAPFAGTVIRRGLKYPDMPLYDWVVVNGEGAQNNMSVKYALVDRTGPQAGEHVEAATSLGKPEWVESEHAGAGRFIHMELFRDGTEIDPRSVMRQRTPQDQNSISP